jgi:hypothetical protein
MLVISPEVLIIEQVLAPTGIGAKAVFCSFFRENGDSRIQKRGRTSTGHRLLLLL